MRPLITSILLLAIISNVAVAQKIINSWNKNQVIAHRGAWKKKGLPENSIASLKEAIRIKCFGSEFDVHLTSDSVMVVNHDPTFYGLSIGKSTYAQLLEKKHPNGEFIPTLEGYLKTGIKQKKTKLILELKPQNMGKERDLFLAESVLKMVRKLKAEPWVDYISFSYDICTYIIAHSPKAKVAYLNGDVAPEKLKADGFFGPDYHYSVFQKNDWIMQSKKLGLAVNAWTVNTVPEMEWLLADKVEFITTNEPELLFEIIKKPRF